MGGKALRTPVSPGNAQGNSAYEALEGASIELTPVKGLYIAATVPLDNHNDIPYNGWSTPYQAGNSVPAGEIFKHTQGRVLYNIGEAASVSTTFIGGSGRVISKDNDAVDAALLDFTFRGIEGIALALTAEVPLPAKKWEKYNSFGGVDGYYTNPANAATWVPAVPAVSSEVANAGTDVKAQLPISLDLRANINKGAFKLNGGVAFAFAGKYTETTGGVDDVYKYPFAVGFTLNPQFSLSALDIGLLGELKIQGESSSKVGSGSFVKDGKDVVAWSVAPYLQKSIGGATFMLGVQFADNDTDVDGIQIAIPLSASIYF
jgi:hypothetical protein